MQPTATERALSSETWSAESGQAVVPLVLILGLFLLGMLGFAVDLTNVWFHRQMASGAADAACEAGAMDMLSVAGGYTPSTMGFTVGTASDCVSSSTATICKYAGFNGYSGAGLVANSASNSIAWTFPSTVAGATAGSGPNSFLQVNVSENVKTFFTGLLTRKKVMNINLTSICGVGSIKGAAPMMVLNPTASGSFYYSGGGQLYIAGGPSRSVQINSSSATAVSWGASAFIDTSAGGPNQTGSDVAVVGGPMAAPANGSSSGFRGGTTGSWKSGGVPVPDPYGNVAAPTSVKSITPATTTSGTWVKYGVDGCPDNTGSTGNSNEACKEFGPGYYPSGINLSSVMNGYSTAIFLPGIYYLNGSLAAGGSTTLRVAVPGNIHTQTDGVMFYFLTGSLNISGGSGQTNSKIDNVPSSYLTCDGSMPSGSLGMPTSLTGNVLYAQCMANGTYYDSSGDTTDTISSSGVRGLLLYEAHTNTTSPTFSGSGSLAFSGALYLHSAGYGTVLSLSGGASSGTFVIGEIVADEVSLTGSGAIRLALNAAKTTSMGKVAMFQ